MNELALFSGAGGGILGGHILGWRTVCAVEWEPYPAGVLCARQNDGILAPFPIWDDVRTFDGKPWRGIVDVVSGGFPCQDISAAGKGGGIEASRSGLWKEMARIIGEVLPRFVFVENSPLLVGRGAAVVIGDLATMGYDAHWCCLSASDVGAPHQRDRFWLVANTDNTGQHPNIRTIHGKDRHHAGICGEVLADAISDGRTEIRRDDGFNDRSIIDASGQYGSAKKFSDTDALGLQRTEWPGRIDQKRRKKPDGPAAECGRWPAEPDVGRVAHGVAARVDRLKAIGNGQVPRVAATAWRILNDE